MKTLRSYRPPFRSAYDIEKAERWVRLGSAAALVLLLSLVYQGLWRGSRRPRGRVIGPTTVLLRGPISLYLLASVLFFGLLYLLWRPLRLALSASGRSAALILGAMLYFPGLALAMWGRLALGDMYNVSTAASVQLYANHRLVTSGPYALVRHPMYLGVQLAALGSLLIFRTWATLFVAVTFLGLALRARREEELLAAEFGEQWTAYRRRVPAWIPFLPPSP